MNGVNRSQNSFSKTTLQKIKKRLPVHGMWVDGTGDAEELETERLFTAIVWFPLEVGLCALNALSYIPIVSVKTLLRFKEEN